MSETKQRPNVIVCLCDQLRAFEVGCYGNEVIRTPHLDRLASQGVRFEVACSNNPVCVPSRSTLLTGQYGRTCTGALGNVADTPPNEQRVRLTAPTLAERFRDAGYETALIGKWHIDPHPRLVGFDKYLYPHHSHRNTGQTYFDDTGNEFEADGFAPWFELARVKEHLAEERDRPFFLFYNISPPHMPLADAPEKYTGAYSADEIPLRDNVWVDGNLPFDEWWFKVYLWDYLYYKEHLPHTEKLPEGFGLRDLLAMYYGLVNCVDDCVGGMLDALRENGLDEDTIVLFVSDHGDNLGSHHDFNKDRLWEESIRVPLMVRWPGRVAPRAVTTQVASTVDIMPTVLGLVGLEPPETVQGTDISPVLRGEAERVGENAALIETTNCEVGVRTLTHLYGLKKTGDRKRPASLELSEEPYLFFDLRSDPYQMSNLAVKEEQKALAAELRARVRGYDAETPWLEPRRPGGDS